VICTAAICVLAVTGISDGDTFRAGGDGFRVWGVTAPERGQPGYQEAKDVMAGLVTGQQLACDRAGPLSFFRHVVACEMLTGPHAGQDLGCLLIRSGTVLEWPSYSGGAYAHCRPE
jgi:endonuclease YncB( thermonuclease family)